MIRKGEGIITNINSSLTPDKDYIVYRLAETYLLRAEAHLKLGNKKAAADDINVIRNRAKAVPVTGDQVSIGYLLDERARELIIEEPRRLTLNRLGLWYEQTKKHSFFEMSKQTIKPFHTLFPIPQTAIDANTGAELKQNPGY
jgi:hypothetical protein